MELLQYRFATFLLMGLVVLNGIAGCKSQPAVTSVFPTIAVSQPSVLPSLTRTPSITSTPTLRSTPTQIPTQKLIHTFTPVPPLNIPTLEAEDAEAEILRLLTEPDSECLFPCWWGLMPGETLIVDARNYLTSLSSVGQSSYEDARNWNQTRIWLFQSQDSFVDIDIYYRGKDESIGWLRVYVQRHIKVVYPSGESGYEISWGDWLVTKITERYSLSEVLLTYGKPAEVVVFTHQAVMMGQPHPLSLVVFYPDHGFMVEYVMDTTYVGTFPNDGIKGCPSLAFPYFWFWEPSETITRKDVLSMISGFDQYYRVQDLPDRFKSLEDATGMSIEDLVTLYSADEDACITTPAAIWPFYEF